MTCGHDRETLAACIAYVRDVWADSDQDMRDVLAIPWRHSNSQRYDAMVAITDPTKLAEIIASEGRRLGLRVAGYVEHDQVCIQGESIKEGWIVLGAPQARTLLAAWLALPDRARDDAEKVLRGAT